MWGREGGSAYLGAKLKHTAADAKGAPHHKAWSTHGLTNQAGRCRVRRISAVSRRWANQGGALPVTLQWAGLEGGGGTHAQRAPHGRRHAVGTGPEQDRGGGGLLSLWDQEARRFPALLALLIRLCGERQDRVDEVHPPIHCTVCPRGSRA